MIYLINNITGKEIYKKDPPDTDQVHTHELEHKTIILEHDCTEVTVKTKDVFRSEFPQHIMNVVQVIFNTNRSHIVIDV